MGIRTRSATPGTIICLIATALLAVVCFNTPLIKSLYFLSATFSSGEYDGTLHLGTMGYCLTSGGKTTCTGPKIGYEFNPNTLLGVDRFNIPETITKYLTYTLVIHFVALACAIASVLFGLLAHINGLAVWCFPTCMASLASSFSLLALIFDLVMFYIAKSRIDAVSGASATIGVSVWLTLAAWIIAGIGGCAYGLGNCCISNRRSQQSGDPKMSYGYGQPDAANEMRLQALRDEQRRKEEQGLPGFQHPEQTPLTLDLGEDKYLDEEQPQTLPHGLRRDGSLVQGVGMGYGRKNSRTPMNGQQQGYPGGWSQPQQGGYSNYSDVSLAPVPVARRPSAASGVTSAGAAGWGAGGAGVESNNAQDYGGQYGNTQQNYEGYSDPYQQQPYGHSAQQYVNPNDSQGQHIQQQRYPSQRRHYYPPQSNEPIPMPSPTPLARNISGGYDPYSGAASSESHYHDPGPRVSQADPYDGYDDGIHGIGMAATSPVIDDASHQRNYTGYPETRYYPSQQQAPLQVPTPQHLVTGNRTAANLLRSPSPDAGVQRQNTTGNQARGYDHGEEDEEDDDEGMRPPSYGAVAGVGGYHLPSTEKSGHR